MVVPGPIASPPPETEPAAGFHTVPVARIVRETDDATTFVFALPPDLQHAFAYRAGQFVNVRVVVDGEAHQRCYSMSSAPGIDEALQVTVKRVPGGIVSNWLNDNVEAGHTIDLSRPAGRFLLDDGDGEVLAFAAGSGITPVLSIVKTALVTTTRPVRLLYANRDLGSIIFDAELARLVHRHGDRLAVVHHLDADSGFVGPDQVRRHVGEPGGSSDPTCYICGPGPFMDIAEAGLLDHGVDPSRIHIERFTTVPTPHDDDPDDLPPDNPDGTACRVTIELDGRTDSTDHQPGTTILQVARQMGMAPPFSCEAGNCATCMAKLTEGAATMFVNDALTDDEVDGGWVLTCQAVPTGTAVHVVYGHEED